ncbi:hypothetical protein DBB_37520 [Desulfoluna spongiiphila]|nr:hypothetical protein DBB_37520 [Desulfoluna spongiiphila]
MNFYNWRLKVSCINGLFNPQYNIIASTMVIIP